MPKPMLNGEELRLTNPQVDPTDLWRNLFSLKDVVTALMQRVEKLEAGRLANGPPSSNPSK